MATYYVVRGDGDVDVVGSDGGGDFDGTVTVGDPALPEWLDAEREPGCYDEHGRAVTLPMESGE